MRYFFFLIVLILTSLSAAAGMYVGLRLSGVTDPPAPATNEEVSGVSRLGQLLALPSVEPTPAPLPPIPTTKTIPGGTHTFQTFNNCGPASLSMALSLHGIPVSQHELGQALRPYQNPQGDNDDKSTTFEELAHKAEEYGFVVYHRPAGDVGLLQEFVAQDMPVLTRTLLAVGDDIGHYRVVKGYDQAAGILIQDDSLQGANLRYSYQDFLDLWKPFNYEFLVLVPSEKHLVAQQILGERTEETNAWQAALELTERALTQNSSDMYAQLNRSVALYHLGRYTEAAEQFEQVEARLPFRTLWYQIEPILTYRELGNHDRVLNMINQILSRQNRAFSELHFLRGQILQEHGDSAGAAAAFADADRYNSTSYWRANL